MDPRFGRAAYFIVVDSDTMDFEVIENVDNINLMQGAGIQAGKTIVEKGAGVLITGFCGPKAFKVLESAGVKTIVGVQGLVKKAVEDFKTGKYTSAKAPNVGGHW
jgi:predicted Fe-Mo cluster-binding NifX family protein